MYGTAPKRPATGSHVDEVKNDHPNARIDISAPFAVSKTIRATTRKTQVAVKRTPR